MSIKIILNNSGPIYPGTLLQGTVQCHFQSRTDVRSIKIRCYGKEHTQWTTGGKHKHHYSGTHYFYQMETKLFEPETSYMEVGSYSYPFTFLLPMNIASVLEFPYGYIRHSLKGIIDIPLAIDPRERLDLNVISVIDINTLPSNLRQPFQAVDQALTGCCFCFDFDPVRMNAQINKRVFIPGETIKINMEIQNMSGDSVTEFIVKLVRCFVAHSETPRHDTRTVNEDLLVQKLGGVGGHGKRDYDVDLYIPGDFPVPAMTGCQIIEAIYRIDVTGITSGFGRNLDMVVAEIQMGHVDGSWPPTNEAGSSQYPSAPPQTSNGYPYPSATGDKVSKPLLGFDSVSANATAPPSYEDVTKGLPSY